MGIDPENDDYEEGAECPTCVDILFDGVTPKYVEADISGIVKCPAVIPDPPNGTVLLTQAAPCVWSGVVNGSDIRWVLGIGISTLIIDTGGFFVWFSSVVADACIDAFVNQNVCGVGPVIGEDGYVLLYWGPTIGP